eukprot:TRINITY_DN55875_c0_g1_i1.p1 TRINITY_DN55875_c0_g1~~TRINITY_DN55875_c0_g1_i1.p1  ORF type:complete len:490 (+),score=101.61 TRINITY_DN55875_c0_g1_i1:144-1613(+)
MCIRDSPPPPLATPLPADRIAEVMFVVGVPLGAAESTKPEVLCQYPPQCTIDDLSCVTNFCMPTPDRARVLSHASDPSSLSRLLHSGVRSAEQGFVFTLQHTPNVKAAEPYTLYGCCIERYEILKWESACAGCVWEAHYPAAIRRVYCVMSRHPFFELHFHVLDSLMERLHAINLAAFPPRDWHPKGSPPRKVAAIDWAYDKEHPTGGSYREVRLGAMNQLFEEYTALPLPGPGERISFRPFNHQTHAIQFTNPTQALQHRLAGAWALSASMLRVVGLAQFVCLFGCLLRERSCVVVCAELPTLTRFVMLLLSSVLPLKWEGIQLVLTPPHLMMMMDAPVPFVLGVQEMPENQNLDGVVVATILPDQASIKLPDNIQAWTQPLRLLHTRLNNLLTTYLATLECQEFPPEIVERALQCFQQCVEQIMEHTDRLGKGMYVGPAAEKAFYADVLRSQLYDCYKQAHPEEEISPHERRASSCLLYTSPSPRDS